MWEWITNTIDYILCCTPRNVHTYNLNLNTLNTNVIDIVEICEQNFKDKNLGKTKININIQGHFIDKPISGIKNQSQFIPFNEMFKDSNIKIIDNINLTQINESNQNHLLFRK